MEQDFPQSHTKGEIQERLKEKWKFFFFLFFILAFLQLFFPFLSFPLFFLFGRQCPARLPIHLHHYLLLFRIIFSVPGMFGGSDSLGEGQKGGKQGAGDEGPLLNVKVNAVEEVTLTVVLVVREGAAPLKEEGGGVALLEEALLVGAARGGVAGVKWRGRRC